jgi:starvation-inducible DNA-binding protein
MIRLVTWRTLAGLSSVALVLSACTAVQPSSSPTADTGPATVRVTLQEWAVVPAATSTPSGELIFQVTNTGPDDIHEFVVLKTDLDPGALPVIATGAVTESGAGIEVVDEIEDIPVGETQELTVTLAAGKYVLLCNIYDETEKEAHYKMGMRIAFEVTD